MQILDVQLEVLSTPFCQLYLQVLDASVLDVQHPSVLDVQYPFPLFQLVKKGLSDLKAASSGSRCDPQEGF
jgi:hypothetical protein